MLTVRDLHAHYGKSHILQGVELRLEAGELVALLGRNGAGKTTTIKAITGEVRPSGGSVTLLGREVAGCRPWAISRLGVGLVPQGRRIFPNLTVRENLTLAAAPSGGPWRLERVLELFPNLSQRLGHRGAQLSGGEQQMVAIGRALAMNPRVLLMDEPSEGIAPLLVARIAEVIRQLKAAGLPILLVEQNLSLALQLADRLYIMNKGRIVYQGTPRDLDRSSTETKRLYLAV